MAKRLVEMFPELAPELRGILSADDGAGEGEGGGDAGTGEGEGDSGEGSDKLKSALERERQRSAEQRRLAGQLKAQLEELKKSADPEVIRAAEARAREAEEKARDAERMQAEAARKAREEAETTYSQQLQQAVSRAEMAERALGEARRRHALESAFYANGGRTGTGEDGVTYFDAFYSLKANDFALDDDGRPYVVNAKGEAVIDTESGKRIKLETHFDTLKEKTVAAAFFQATQGAGSGGLGARSAGGRVNPQSADFQSLSPAAKIAAVFGTVPGRK